MISFTLALIVLSFTKCIHCFNDSYPAVSFTTLPVATPEKLAVAALGIYNDTLFVIGGLSSTFGTLNTIYKIETQYLFNSGGGSQWSVSYWDDNDGSGLGWVPGFYCSSCYASIDNLLYIVNPWPEDSMFIFDMATQTQINGNNYNFSSPMIDDWFPCVVTDGKLIYVMGGHGGNLDNGALNSLQIYNPQNDSWTIGASMDVGRAEASCWYDEFKSQILIAGGKYRSTYPSVTTTIEIYDIKTDSWSYASSTTDNMFYGASIITINYNQLPYIYKRQTYTLGGYNGAYIDSIEVITRSTKYSTGINDETTHQEEYPTPAPITFAFSGFVELSNQEIGYYENDYDIYGNQTSIQSFMKQVLLVGGRQTDSQSGMLDAIRTVTIYYNNTNIPSMVPTNVPTYTPTVPSYAPSFIPSSEPTDPTFDPTVMPSMNPTVQPTVNPTMVPTVVPSNDPSTQPSTNPSMIPSTDPTSMPTEYPTRQPTNQPTVVPSKIPSEQPSIIPSVNPSIVPSINPSSIPTMMPTAAPNVKSESQSLLGDTLNENSDILWLVIGVLFTLLCIFIFMSIKYLIELKCNTNKRNNGNISGLSLERIMSMESHLGHKNDIESQMNIDGVEGKDKIEINTSGLATKGEEDSQSRSKTQNENEGDHNETNDIPTCTPDTKKAAVDDKDVQLADGNKDDVDVEELFHE